MKYSEFNNKKKIRRPEGKAPGNANGQDQIGAVRYGPLFSSHTSMNNLYIRKYPRPSVEFEHSKAISREGKRISIEIFVWKFQDRRSKGRGERE